MRHILYILFIVSLLLGNDELNKYLNNQKLQHQIIKDEKNQRIIVDLLYDESRMIIFSKNQNKDYQKTFDEKLYFCNNKYSNIMARFENNKLFIVCSMPNVDDSLYREFYYFEQYSSLNDKLLSIHKQYINIDNDTIKASYIFIPKKNIPTLASYTDKIFSDDYLFKNRNNFIELDNKKNNIFPFIQKYSLANIEKNLKQKKDLETYNKDFFIQLLVEKPIEKETLTPYNNIAYYLQKAGANEEAIYLLEKILEKYPDRTVAHYNLADAYWGLGKKEKAIASYKTYIEQMKTNGKEKRIPKIVKDRVKGD